MSGAYISRLKCRNFKSFKSVSLNLIKGFQAFMGPNGSGKSNLTDAIRFVLGETRLSLLRAKTIKDLINHESDYAEVSVVIDSPEGNIEVSRRIDRNGKSDYRINGRKCSRGSIVETLRKYNIENGAHNVIGQGEVQRIVEMNPVERRKIIDEIAGVAEFDAKKNEAMKELDTVQSRINDTKLVLKEREGYLKDLEEEREVALRYMEIKKKVTNLRNSVIYLEINRIEKEYDNTTKEYAMKKTKLKEIEQSISQIDEKIKAESQKISELSDEINKKSADNSAYREYEQLRTNVAVASEKKSMLEKQASQLRKQAEEIASKKSQLEKELSEYGDEADEYSAKLNELRSELAELKRRLDMSKKRNSTLVNESIKLGSDIESLEKEIDQKEKLANELSLKVTRADYLANAKKEEMKKIEASLNEDVKSGAKEIEREIKELEKSLDEKRKLLDKLFAKERKCNEQNAEIDKTLLKLKSEYSNYRAVNSRLQSENVIKFIHELKEKSAVRGVHGAVHELCNFDSKYATAIESAVGGRLNYVIVDSVDTSKEIIQHLRSKRIGRATFLPLNMKVNVENKKLNYPGVLGRLIDFIEYDPKYSGPMHYVFGDTVLINNIEIAKDVGLIGKARLVTIDGDIIEKSSAVTGGHFISSLRLKERKRAGELEEKIEKLQREKESLISELYELRDSSAKLRRERSEIEVRIRALQIERDAASKKREEIEQLSEKLKQIKKEMVEISRQKNKDASEFEKIKNAIARAREKLENMRKRKTDIDSVLFKKSNADEERMNNLIEEISQMEGKMRGKDAEKDMLVKSIGDAESQLASINARITGLTDEISETEKKIEGMETIMDEKKIEMEKESKKIRSLVKRREEMQSVVDAYSEEKGAHIRQKEKLLQEFGKIETRKAVLEQKLTDLKSEANDEEFELIEGNINKLKSELRTHEAELEGMGEVNLLAPKVYEQRMEEVKEISEKLDKLEKERESVIEMIKEVEKRKISVFMEAFRKVNLNFGNLFSQTFGEGRGYLKLQNEQDPFNGGIEVKLVKSNSKEERIEGLSGGERSVIAILLVFAMHMYRPSAFYILDEVESALDKVRSRLLAKLLNKLASKTQFIVVSHNDTIISSAEAVIGVSKTPAGSKIVSLALNKPIASKVKGK